MGQQPMKKKRCEWCESDPLLLAYHDEEWGVPVHDDRLLFEMLILEGAQAGLSWLTVLKKREGYRKALHNFDHHKIAAYTQGDIKRLLANPGIIRNRLKVESLLKNARGVIALQEEFGSFDAYLWRFTDGIPLKNTWKTMSEIPATSPQSDAMGKDLKKRGFNFVGSTICYAFMQGIGMVNDHTTNCFRFKEVGKCSAKGKHRAG
jgi:DNA-3-methyladenine glycosylase I